MFKLHQIFFTNFVVLFLVTLIVSGFVGYITLEKIELEQAQNSLTQLIDVVEDDLIQSPNLENTVAKLHEITNIRITIIDASGVVLAESNKDKTNMDNHAKREEIVQAKAKGVGQAIRYSTTLKKDFLYVAKPIAYDKQLVYVRFSRSIDHIMENFVMMWQRVALLFSFLLFIGFLLNRRVSNKIALEIDSINQYLEAIANKEYKTKFKPNFSNEFVQMAKNLKTLVQKLDKRDRQKQKYTAKLRLMNKQRNAILSSISHEFKNPVAVIIGYAETLQEDSSDPMQQRFLNKIVQNGNKISTMISRMNLSLSLEYNDFTLQKEMIDIRTLVHDVVSNMQKKYKDRTIHLTNHSRRLHIDPTLFDMLITNLIDNALKYSQDDIFVTVSDKSLSVEDQGIGIAQDDIDNITQRFYRVSKNRWDNSLGLGLSIVQFIVKLHDMQLRIDSTVGEGSTFKVIWQLGEESGE